MLIHAIILCLMPLQVTVDGERTTVEGLTHIVNGLDGNRQYTVTVQVINGARLGLGMAADVDFTTEAGAAQPAIAGVSTNLDTNTYSIEIGVFSEEFGPLRSVCASLSAMPTHSLTPYTATMRCLW